MGSSIRYALGLAFGVGLALLVSCAGQARADIVSPAVSGTVEDSTGSGVGDRVLAFPTFPIVRRLGPPQFPSTLADSAILQYDLSSFQGETLTQATLAGGVASDNALPTGPRIVEIELFAANGTLQPSDFEAPGVSLGTVTYQPESGVFGASFDFDILAQLQTLLDEGTRYLGVRLEAVDVQAPGLITGPDGFNDLPTLTLAAQGPVVPEPGSLTLLGLGGLGLAGYGWRRKRAAR